MGTTLHILRHTSEGERGTITINEWKQAVGRQKGMRMAHGDASAMVPTTGEAVIMPNRGGDAEVWREDCQDWLRTFWWSPMGHVSFALPSDGNDPTLRLAQELADYLGAELCDDEGKFTA